MLVRLEFAALSALWLRTETVEDKDDCGDRPIGTIDKWRVQDHRCH
jgi:hypothetical protein